VNRVELEDPFSPDLTLPVMFRGDSNLLNWLLDESQSLYIERNFESRVRVALQICSDHSQPDVASLIRGLLLLGDEGISPTLCHTKDGLHRTLLHCVCWHLGEQYRRSPNTFSSFLNEYREDAASTISQACRNPTQRLFKLASELVAAGSDVHALANRFDVELSPTFLRKDTPLTAILSGFFAS
jgi:hypothetical protein